MDGAGHVKAAGWIVAAALAAAVSGCSADAGAAGGGSAETPAETGTPDGDEATAGDRGVTVHGVICGITSVGRPSGLRPQGTFCAADVTVRNLTSNPIEIDDRQFYAVEGGNVFPADPIATSIRNHDVGRASFFDSPVPAEMSVRSDVVFDLPAGTVEPDAVQADGGAVDGPVQASTRGVRQG